MHLNKQRFLSLAAVCGALAVSLSASLQAGEPSAAGVARISDRATGIQPASHVKYRVVSPHELMNGTLIHPVGRYSEPCNGNCGSGCGRGHGGRHKGKGLFTGLRLFGRHSLAGKAWDANMRYKKCKYGYFIPTGCGGGGCPWFGTYDIVYPANPQYFDSRDGKLYGAQGHGIPMAVPLAPNVRHTYNYGWGIPSSRRTPISQPAPHIRVINP